MLLRFVTGTSLFVIVLTSAVAAPVMPPPDTPIEFSAIPVRAGDDVTGSIGVAPPPGSQLLGLRQAINAYEKGGFPGGDAIARSLNDPASRAAAESIAIRTASARSDSNASAPLRAYPSWPAAPGLRKRAKEALYNDAADAGTVRAFFAAARPRPTKARLPLPVPCCAPVTGVARPP